MRKMPLFIARHARLPAGVIGWIVAQRMQSGTALANERAVELLDVRSNETVLDVGCGSGHALKLIAARLDAGRVIGVDPSRVMVRRARAHLREHIRSCRAVVVEADASRMVALEDASVDKAMTVHTVYFWPSPLQNLREIRRVLKPGGVLLIGMRHAADETFRTVVPSDVYCVRTADEMVECVEHAGFSGVKAEYERIGGREMVWIKAFFK